MELVNFALPDGWTYDDLRGRLADAITEKYGSEGGFDPESGAYFSGVYPWLRNFDDKLCYYCLTGSDIYQESYTIAGTEATLGDDQKEVIETTKYLVSTEVTGGEADFFDGTYQIPPLHDHVVGFMDDLVYYRTGKIFEAGDYPDKNFSITPEELAEAVAEFKPVPNKGAHVPTVFDGKMGTLESVELADDGVTLLGRIAIPKWLNDLHGSDNPLRASLEWRRDTKRIHGNTLIPNPRVADSALMAAFTAGQTSKPGLGTTIRALLGIQSPEAAKEKEKEKVEMSQTVTDQTAAMKEAVDAAVKAAVEAERTQNAAHFATQTAQIENLKKNGRKNIATATVKDLFNSRHIVTAQVPALTALFEQAIALDETTPGIVEFADTAGVQQKANFADTLEAVIRTIPPHKLNVETLPSNPLFTLGGQAEFSGETEDEATDQGKKTREWAAKQQGKTAAK